MIRIAASEIYLKAEKANLADQVVRLTQSCEKMTLQSATDRAELDKITVRSATPVLGRHIALLTTIRLSTLVERNFDPGK